MGECNELITAYLDRVRAPALEEAGGEEDDDARDPLDTIDNGVVTITRAVMAVTVDPRKYPQQNSAMDARLFGALIGKSDLARDAVDAVDMMMDVFNDGPRAVMYYKGKKAGAEAKKEVEMNDLSPSRIPAGAELERIESFDSGVGMPWRESVALSHALVLGGTQVISAADATAAGWKSDPRQHQQFRDRKKLRISTYGEQLDARDGLAYSEWLLQASYALDDGGWAIASAVLNKFVAKLRRATIDQGAPELFVAYMEQIMTRIVHMPIRRAAPLDPQLFQDYVLAVRSTSNKKDDAELAAAALEIKMLKEQNAELVKSHHQTASRIGQMEKAIKSLDSKADDGSAKPSLFSMGTGRQFGHQGAGTSQQIGPPSDANPCNKCGAPDHFARECPHAPAEAAKLKTEHEARRAGKTV